MYNFSTSDDTPYEVKIIMVRIAYIGDVLKQNF